jgi:hypothetical protein
MMIEVEALSSLVGIGIFLAILYGPWQWYRADVARQEIFEIRDEFFDVAANGRIDFRSSEYQAIRDGLNAQIRLAPRLTWPRLILFWIVVGRHINLEQSNRVRAAVRRIKDQKTRDEASILVTRATIANIEMMFWKSATLMVLAIPAIASMFMFAAARETDRALKAKLKLIGGALIQYEAERVTA